MASYSVHRRAVTHARRLIEARRYVLDSDWAKLSRPLILHRTALIACQFRAAEWRHKQVELAAHRLFQYLDKKSG